MAYYIKTSPFMEMVPIQQKMKSPLSPLGFKIAIRKDETWEVVIPYGGFHKFLYTSKIVIINWEIDNFSENDMM